MSTPLPSTRRPRPRARWFVVAAVLVVAGVVVAIGGVWFAAATLDGDETRVRDDGRAVEVEVTSGEDHLIWTREDDLVRPQCTVVDADGETLDLEPADYDFERNRWHWDTTFTPTADTVEVTCPEGTGDVEIGRRPNVALFLVGLFGGLGGGALLIGGGFTWLLVLTILFALGERRTPSA